MARIRVPGIGAELEAGAATSLLNALLAAGVSIRHDCGGKAICGTCAVRIAEGGSGLSPVAPPEAARLAATGRGEGWRLACQARAARDLSIEIPVRESESGGES
jgi:ferredoxin